MDPAANPRALGLGRCAHGVCTPLTAPQPRASPPTCSTPWTSRSTWHSTAPGLRSSRDPCPQWCQPDCGRWSTPLSLSLRMSVVSGEPEQVVRDDDWHFKSAVAVSSSLRSHFVSSVRGPRSLRSRRSAIRILRLPSRCDSLHAETWTESPRRCLARNFAASTRYYRTPTS